MRPTSVLFLLPTTAWALSLSALSPHQIPSAYADCASAYSTPLPCDTGCTPTCLAALETLQLTSRRACASVPTTPGLLRDLQEGRLKRVLCSNAFTSPAIVTPTVPVSIGDKTMTASLVPEPSISEYSFVGYKTAPAVVDQTYTHITMDTGPEPTPDDVAAEALVVDSRPSPSPSAVGSLFLEPPVNAATGGVKVSSTSWQEEGPARFDAASAGAATDVRWRLLGLGVVVGLLGGCA